MERAEATHTPRPARTAPLVGEETTAVCLAMRDAELDALGILLLPDPRRPGGLVAVSVGRGRK